MRISDWSSDVCSSDLWREGRSRLVPLQVFPMLFEPRPAAAFHVMRRRGHPMRLLLVEDDPDLGGDLRDALTREGFVVDLVADGLDAWFLGGTEAFRSEEHTSELQSLMRHLVCRLLLEKKHQKN